MALDFSDPFFLCVAGGTLLAFIALVIQTTSVLSCIHVLNGQVKRQSCSIRIIGQHRLVGRTQRSLFSRMRTLSIQILDTSARLISCLKSFGAKEN